MDLTKDQVLQVLSELKKDCKKDPKLCECYDKIIGNLREKDFILTVINNKIDFGDMCAQSQAYAKYLDFVVDDDIKISPSRIRKMDLKEKKKDDDLVNITLIGSAKEHAFAYKQSGEHANIGVKFKKDFIPYKDFVRYFK